VQEVFATDSNAAPVAIVADQESRIRHYHATLDAYMAG
jgi:hypothetical protein